MTSRKYIVIIVAVVLLIWGPIDHSWPAWLAIRTGYLIAIPLVTWFLLAWLWKVWQPDKKTEDRLKRSLTSAIAGVLLIFVVLEAKADTHVGNTQWIRDGHGGMEAVGDDIILEGPDWGTVIMLSGASAFCFWLSISKPDSKE